MDAAEVKDRLKSVINNLIKDQPDDASKELHDVLAAKMRARISPEGEGSTEVDTDEVEVGDEEEVDDGDDTGFDT